MAMLFLLVALIAAACQAKISDLTPSEILTRLPGEPLPDQNVILRSHHHLQLHAGGGSDSAITQEVLADDCSRFTMEHQLDERVALKSCHGLYLTAPERSFGEGAAHTSEMLLVQEPVLGDCGKFKLYDVGDSRIALRTCSGNFVSAVDGSQAWNEAGMAWSVAAYTDVLDDWEMFTVMPEPQPPMLADFDWCHGVGWIEPMPGDDSLLLSYERVNEQNCIARMEYRVTSWAAPLIRLLGADFSPYTELAFDIKSDSPDVLEEVKVELKRPGVGSKLFVSEITTDWTTVRLNLADFSPSLGPLTEMQELLFTVGPNPDGSVNTGVFYLDNIRLVE
jgi:hypothetical protein